jgi:hypothetical protein
MPPLLGIGGIKFYPYPYVKSLVSNLCTRLGTLNGRPSSILYFPTISVLVEL